MSEENREINPEKVEFREETSQVELGYKRLRLPFRVYADCPDCGESLDDQYLNQPVIGDVETLTLHCDECNEWFDIDIRLDFTIEKVEV